MPALLCWVTTKMFTLDMAVLTGAVMAIRRRHIPMPRRTRTHLPSTRILQRISQPMFSRHMATTRESASGLVKATMEDMAVTMVEIMVATVRIMVATVRITVVIAAISEATTAVVITADIID